MIDVSSIFWAHFHGGSYDAGTCVYDAAGNVIETHAYAGEFNAHYEPTYHYES
jgi:hypothetical protein